MSCKLVERPDGVLVSSDRHSDIGALYDVLTDLAEVIEAALVVDEILATGDEQVPASRVKAAMALKLKREHYLEEAERMSSQMAALLRGEVTASQVGFPEFEEVKGRSDLH